jgi:acetate kinase
MPPRATPECVLTINGGSSSLKFAVYEATAEPILRYSGKVERIGLSPAGLKMSDPDGRRREDRPVEAADPVAAARLVLELLDRDPGRTALQAIAHRVVHGGLRYFDPAPVTDAMLRDLHGISPFDPDHLPGEVALIEAFGEEVPGVLQIACFDTAFHRTLRREAQIVPLPRRYQQLGVKRYGYHGLSYEYLVSELARISGSAEAQGRLILAHLGSGASLAAVHRGRSVDTTMGFTPNSGLVMGTRTGDIDPGLGLFLARFEGKTPEEFHHMVNHESGLLGVSETSPDLRDLLARATNDVRAAEAVALFVYTARKQLGAMAAVLGGVDTLVFAGGIGENAPDIRARICDGLDFLGIALDRERNAAGAGLISPDAARVRVRVIPTDEEIEMARAAVRALAPAT